HAREGVRARRPLRRDARRERARRPAEAPRGGGRRARHDGRPHAALPARGGARPAALPARAGGREGRQAMSEAESALDPKEVAAWIAALAPDRIDAAGAARRVALARA